MWWGVATLTTVGYGDIYPVTPMGKFLGAVISLLGIGLFAMPTGILSSGFVEEVRKIVREEMEEQKKNFWVPAEKHYLDHKEFEDCKLNRGEWLENHDYVSSLRANHKKISTVGWTLAAAAVFGFIFTVFQDGFIVIAKKVLAGNAR